MGREVVGRQGLAAQITSAVAGRAASPTRWPPSAPWHINIAAVVRTGTTSLPAELQRILNSIKDLDERSDGAQPPQQQQLGRRCCRRCGVLPATWCVLLCRQLTPFTAAAAPAAPCFPADLAAQIQENVEAALKMPPASGGSTRKGSSSGAAEAEELAALRAQIESDQRLLIQFAEEKVQLAVQGYDLLEQHLAQADFDIMHLEQEVGGVKWWVGTAGWMG